MSEEITRQIRVYGIVQGVGFRPTVSRHAAARGIHGNVCNKGPYVEIYAQGPEEAVSGFISDIENRPPKRAAILKINVENIENSERYTQFDIIESEKTKGEIFVSPDIAICEECKEEMFDPKNRRYLHPFINCTCCGPRLTILDSLPYDRERTSMKEFPMCPDCAKEYNAPATRRYDAQPVCCNECGPEVYLIGREERGREAITYARKTIVEGGIVAIKGIGGFHLCCDASNETAVRKLRQLKRRPMKPFAVMAKNLEAVRKECEVSAEQTRILDGHQKPILLLDKKKEAKILCPSVAPGNPKVGIMLPYAPVQLLIFTYDDGIEMPEFLVMTSGNTSGAPICRDDQEAEAELSGFCDCMLSHDRKIRIRADDSVMDFYEDRPYMIRRSRGYAPLPFMVSTPYRGQVLAIGGELKNSFCIGVDNRFYPSPYVGDLEDLRTVKALRETVGRMETLLEVEPEIVCCDMHPKYNSVMVAEELGLPVVKVQHHYAHILSCMAENDCAEQVIGVSFDGTGYGTDGTIWGGEILLSDLDGFTRVGSVMPFLQVGGDASSKEGWRIAVSLIYGMTGDRKKAAEITEKLELCTKQEANVQFTMADRKINAVISTSAGRLFDGVSAMPKLYTYGVENPIMAIENLTATTLRNIIGDLELDQTLTSRETINTKMRAALDVATDPWGIKVNRVELKNIIPPAAIQDAMEKQMKAERERREAILKAEGEKKSTILVAEGKKQSVILDAEADKQSAILRAEAEKEKRIKEAEGQAEAILKIQQATADGIRFIKEAGADNAVIQLKSLEAFAKAADGKATKIIIPSEIQGLAGLVKSVAEVAKDEKTE